MSLRTKRTLDFKGSFCGADNRTRTGDLRLTKAVHYLLCYISIWLFCKCLDVGCKTKRPGFAEPCFVCAMF